MAAATMTVAVAGSSGSGVGTALGLDARRHELVDVAVAVFTTEHTRLFQASSLRVQA